MKKQHPHRQLTLHSTKHASFSTSRTQIAPKRSCRVFSVLFPKQAPRRLQLPLEAVAVVAVMMLLLPMMMMTASLPAFCSLRTHELKPATPT
jgi:hypothetical protein